MGVDLVYLFKGSPQEISGMCKGNFFIFLTEIPFYQHCLFKFLPVPYHFTFIVYHNLFHDLVRFNIKKGEVGKYVVNFRAAPGNLYVHLLFINTVAVSAAFGGDDWLKMRVFIPFITGEINVSALLNSVW